MVEVLHFMGGEDSPRRVLCPWRAHRLASTLPAVARATAVCFLRCECLIGRGVGRPRDPSHRWGARCSSHGCPAVFRGSQQVPQRRTDALFSRLSRPDEHLAPQRWATFKQFAERAAKREHGHAPHASNREQERRIRHSTSLRAPKAPTAGTVVDRGRDDGRESRLSPAPEHPSSYPSSKGLW